jgi:hypothetical protein
VIESPVKTAQQRAIFFAEEGGAFLFSSTFSQTLIVQCVYARSKILNFDDIDIVSVQNSVEEDIVVNRKVFEKYRISEYNERREYNE